MSIKTDKDGADEENEGVLDGSNFAEQQSETS